MDGIESAIRNALARGDARDRAFRERVYRSVFGALERKIAETPGVSAEDAQRRRDVLKHRIVEIERQLAAAPPPAAPPPAAPPVGPAAPSPAPQAPAVAPAVEVSPRAAERPMAAPAIDGPRGRGEPHAGMAPDISVDPSFPGSARAPRGGEAPAARDSGDFALPGVRGDMNPDMDEAAEERRRPWGILLIAVTLVAILGIGAWWALETGLFGREDGSVPNPPVVLEDEEFDPDNPPPLSQDADAREWTTVFSAAGAQSIVATGGAIVEMLAEEEGVQIVRLRSPTAQAALNIPLSQEVLAPLAGRSVMFDVVARAQEGRETQISVSCDFAGAGNCGRRRYVVGLHRSDYLLEVDLPGALSGRSSISIITDVDGGGNAIDLFEIRVAPAQ